MAPRQTLGIAVAICAAAAASSSLATTAAAITRKNSPGEYVELHNAARAAAGAGPVQWDAAAARHAGERAAAGCRNTSGAGAGGRYGENVFRGAPGKGWEWDAADAVRAWTAATAREHAQVVWPGSTKVGCARAVCGRDGGGVVISCSYKPPG
ncbi:unnamed protein product [Urochloa humidicola]